MTNLYVGNISYRAEENELMELFSQFGEVESLNIIRDRETGRSRGFGFVMMESENAQKAIEALDGKEFEGRRLRVNEAKPRPKRW